MLIALDQRISDLSEAKELVEQIAAALPASLSQEPTASASGCELQAVEPLRRVFSPAAPTFVSVNDQELVTLEDLFRRLESSSEWALVELPLKGHGRLTASLAAGKTRAAVADFYSSSEEDDAHLSSQDRESEVALVSKLIEMLSGDVSNLATSRALATRLFESLRARESHSNVELVASAWSYGLKRNRLVRFQPGSTSADFVSLAGILSTLREELRGDWSARIGQPLEAVMPSALASQRPFTIDIGKPAALELMDTALATVVEEPRPESMRIPREAIDELLALPSESLAKWASVTWELRSDAAVSPSGPSCAAEASEVSIVAKRSQIFQIVLDGDFVGPELRRLRHALSQRLGLKLKVLQRD